METKYSCQAVSNASGMAKVTRTVLMQSLREDNRRAFIKEEGSKWTALCGIHTVYQIKDCEPLESPICEFFCPDLIPSPCSTSYYIDSTIIQPNYLKYSVSFVLSSFPFLTCFPSPPSFCCTCTCYYLLSSVRLFSDLPLSYLLSLLHSPLFLFLCVNNNHQVICKQHFPPFHSSDFRTQNIHHNNEEERSEPRPLVQPNLHLKLCLSTSDSKHRSCFPMRLLQRSCFYFQGTFPFQTAVLHLSRYSLACLF